MVQELIYLNLIRPHHSGKEAMFQLIKIKLTYKKFNQANLRNWQQMTKKQY